MFDTPRQSTYKELGEFLSALLIDQLERLAKSNTSTNTSKMTYECSSKHLLWKGSPEAQRTIDLREARVRGPSSKADEGDRDGRDGECRRR